jgi:hypothetical protein
MTNAQKYQVALAAAQKIVAGYRAQAPVGFDGYNYLGTIATIAAIVAAAGSISSMAYQATQSGPTIPSPYSSSRQVAQATFDALPIQRGLQAAEAQGGQYSMWDPAHTQAQQFVKVPTDFAPNVSGVEASAANGAAASFFGPAGTIGAGEGGGIPGVSDLFGTHQQYKYIPYHAEDWQQGGKYAHTALAKGPNAPGSDAWLRNHVVTRGQHIPGRTDNLDFRGYGTADIQGELARQMEQVQQQLEEKYGTQFAEEARKEAELADPQGFAARDKEYQMIQDELNHPMPINPLSGTLDQQTLERLKAGSGLDAMSNDLLDSAVARANADRGGSTRAGDVANEMSTGMEGAARRQAGVTAAQNWLSSGSTPADIEYRREQQALADAGAFVGGRTPESQFGNLSGAGRGAAPFSPGGPNQEATSGAANAAPGFGVSAWQQSLRNQSSQANPWMAGLSGLLGSIGALAPSAGSGTGH